jgi:hypothetical protein
MGLHGLLQGTALHFVLKRNVSLATFYLLTYVKGAEKWKRIYSVLTSELSQIGSTSSEEFLRLVIIEKYISP